MLRNQAFFALFVTSYLPLFILVIFKQVFTNWNFLHWGGFSIVSVLLMFKKFGIALILCLLSLFGWLGYKLTFNNLNHNAHNGKLVILKNVKNINSEAIGYIATYILPFLFQNFDQPFEVFAFVLLLFIIFRIYINSRMVLINPILSMRYAIYEIEYEVNQKKNNGLVITKEKYLDEDINVKLLEIGHKLYFLTQNNFKQ